MRTIKKWYRWISCGVSPAQFWIGVSLLAVYSVGKALAIEALEPGYALPFLIGVGDLFGTDKGATTVQNVQNSEPWKGIQPYLTDLFGRSQALANQGTGLAPQSQETQQAQGLLYNRATAGSPMTGAAQNLGMGLLGGQYLDPYQNPHFKPALDQTLGDIQSRINSQFRGSNYGSSAHQEWLGKGLMGAAAPALSQAFQANQDRQYGALGMAPQLAGMDYGDIGVLQQLGAQKDARAQAQLDAPWQNLQRYQSGIFPVAGIGGQSSGSTQQPYYQNNTMGTLGAAASGLGAYLGFAAMSDRRAKKDIEKVGQREDGLNIYEFRYKTDKDDAPKRIGFMADEVERVRPEAVTVRDGVKWVDYGIVLK